MNYLTEGYKFKIIQNLNGFYAVIHNGFNFTIDYNHLTFNDCIETARYFVKNKQTYLLKKGK